MSPAEEDATELTMIDLFIGVDEECERTERSSDPTAREIPTRLREAVKACREQGVQDLALFLISLFPFWTQATVAEKEAVIKQVMTNKDVQLYMSSLYSEALGPRLPQPSNN